MDHTAKDTGGVLDGFAASKLDVVAGKEHDIATEFANPDLERDACSGRGFSKNNSPCLSRKWLIGSCGTSRLHFGSEIEKRLKFLGIGFFD